MALHSQLHKQSLFSKNTYILHLIGDVLECKADNSGPPFCPGGNRPLGESFIAEALVFTNAAMLHKGKCKPGTALLPATGRPLNEAWDKQNTEGSDLIPLPLFFVFRL